MPSKVYETRHKRRLRYTKNKSCDVSSKCFENNVSGKKRHLETVPEINKRKSYYNEDSVVKNVPIVQLTDVTRESPYQPISNSAKESKNKRLLEKNLSSSLKLLYDITRANKHINEIQKAICTSEADSLQVFSEEYKKNGNSFVVHGVKYLNEDEISAEYHKGLLSLKRKITDTPSNICLPLPLDPCKIT
ncbi:hypothetical protein JTE90_021329 [Oedothorax gibbosus]|uniref:Uncharacterized protein n=1 Tax=Oedothorax gibbosus TaxID=931172 RepID=A0AAV6VM32_9ARAC|nr:hypothetical protein JTE90_021329 [Oedothorax gibbosus]